ncbi:MAG TPA: aminotransferase class III-fold pyridoxal phosphate-dependent enzyme [Conexibacter sp.]|jgi:putrescine aminotransferase|nr:aminotransferase class III-fold pyridoxal phosphate-dependent enzyme [Conexibacter sp.]
MTTSLPTSSLWHPFADMGAVAGAPFTLVRGQGTRVWDDAGREYIDGSAALWYANLGHGRPEIAEAVAQQLAALDAYSIFGDYANRPALELAERLAALAPAPGTKVFLGSGGGDAVDTAAKIARRHHALNGEPERVHLISRVHGYHGTHGIGTGIAGIPPNAAGFGPLVPDASTVAFDDPDALEHEIARVGAGRVAAFFCEPVIGAGGVHLPPDGYVEAVAEICARHGVLFVADCVIAGFGRLGTWLGIDRWPVAPDLITLAKGVTGGTLPLGATLVAPHVAAPFFTDAPGAPVLRHGATYAGHPTCCAAALAALEIYEREDLIERGRTLEGPLHAALAPLAAHELVAEVRGGLGLLAAVELTQAALDADPGAVGRWQLACREQGVIVRALGRGLAVSPPLTIAADEIATIARAMHAGLDALVPEGARA